ncbi:MAG: PDDEXK nuclease domain-containing protein [Candidatus Muirbacterium halophilum]|nr:PDDEXK nuclease domain-containing protein [Candidatus Muirbacterium halophilum]
MSDYMLSSEYIDFIKNIKKEIIHSRQKAVRKVNSELIMLYYYIGKNIVLKQENYKWGDDLIGQIEKDLKAEFPDLSGFSRRNLNYMRMFYLFIPNQKFVQQVVAQIPWGHIIVILTKLKKLEEAVFYINETIENSWSRVILEHQIELDLYSRNGKLVSNFDKTISNDNLELVENSFKENYVFDFLNLTKKAKEKDLENALIENITHLLIELGKGFAFVGRQKKIIVGEQEFFIDLLFYNYILKRFVVIELKTVEFLPEHFGQISFYVTAVDKNIKGIDDKETIGLLICKSKNNTVVEYALANNSKPLGVAEYKFKEISKDISEFLPSEKELKEAIGKSEEDIKNK